MHKRLILLSVLCGVALSVSGRAQFDELKKILVSAADQAPRLGRLVQEEPPITTSLKDAYTELSVLDYWNPKHFEQMTELERGPHGGFLLRSGLWELQAQSYCLKAGTHAPGGGDGYVYARLAGPQASIVQNLLRRSVAQPHIPQNDIQVLLWAILARTKISDMSHHMQWTAAQLLTPQELLKLNGIALGAIPQAALEKAAANLPPLLRQVVQAETDLRRMLTEGSFSFEQLERIAVLLGEPAWGEGSREIPLGRWAYHPDGYFVRYEPEGYSQTRIQLAAPAPMRIEYDWLGRITVLADSSGNRIETEYNDNIEPLVLSGDPFIRGYAFKTIRYVSSRSDGSGRPLSAEWHENGWTFVSLPDAGRDAIAAPDPRFREWRQRYEHAQDYQHAFNDFRDRLDRAGYFRSWHDVRRAVDLEHYRRGLEAAMGYRLQEAGGWMGEHTDLATRAWQYVTCRMAGGCDERGPAGREYDPSGDVAIPGNTARQRLGLSARAL